MIKQLELILKNLRSNQHADVGTDFAKAWGVIIQDGVHVNLNNNDLMFHSKLAKIFSSFHLTFGFQVSKDLMTDLYNPKLSQKFIKIYKEALHKLNLNNDKYTGEVFIYDNNYPTRLRLANRNDLSRAITKIISYIKAQE